MYKAGFASDLIIKDNELLTFNLNGETVSSDDMSNSYNFLQEDEFGNAPDYNYLME